MTTGPAAEDKAGKRFGNGPLIVVDTLVWPFFMTNNFSGGETATAGPDRFRERREKPEPKKAERENRRDKEIK